VNDQAAALRAAAESRKAARVHGSLRCIAIGSGKGGVGKTMVSIGLAYGLAKRGYRVLLMDADLGLANVDLQMGLDPTYTMQDVIFGACTLEEAVVPVENGPDVLAASSGSQEMVDMGDARRALFVEELVRFAGQYDYFLIDVGAGIGRQVTTFLAAAPEVLVVVANEPTSIMDAYSLIKVLRGRPNPPVVMMVLNMVRSLEEGDLLASRLNAITERFLGVKIPVAGVVTFDPLVSDSIRRRTPVSVRAARSAPAQCLEDLARFIVSGASYHRAGGQLKKTFFNQLTDMGMGKELKEEAS
jgi:flagellar biosynthesis protein FlhG